MTERICFCGTLLAEQGVVEQALFKESVLVSHETSVFLICEMKSWQV